MGQTTEEILDSLSEEDIVAYTADPATEGHIVVGADRFITVPDELKRIAVQYDHDIETVTFDCPRYWDGIDMATMRIYINYLRPDNVKGTFAATNISVDINGSDIMHFDWVISKNVTMAKGTLAFLVCINKTDGEGNEVNHWNSEINKEMYISEGLECKESIVELYPDIITDLLRRMDQLEGAVNGDLIDEILAEIEAIKTYNLDQDNTIVALSSRMDTDEKNLSNLEAKVVANETAISGIDGRVTTNEGAITSLQSEVETLKGAVGTDLANRVATNEINIAALQTDITLITDELSAITSSEAF